MHKHKDQKSPLSSEEVRFPNSKGIADRPMSVPSSITTSEESWSFSSADLEVVFLFMLQQASFPYVAENANIVPSGIPWTQHRTRSFSLWETLACTFLLSSEAEGFTCSISNCSICPQLSRRPDSTKLPLLRPDGLPDGTFDYLTIIYHLMIWLTKL